MKYMPHSCSPERAVSLFVPHGKVYLLEYHSEHRDKLFLVRVGGACEEVGGAYRRVGGACGRVGIKIVGETVLDGWIDGHWCMCITRNSLLCLHSRSWIEMVVSRPCLH